MRSYTTLAVLALAVSTASPAFSAPVLESKKLARADIDERASILPSGLGSDVGSLVKSIGTNAAFGAVPVAIEHFLGGNSTRRALSDDEKRSSTLGSIIKKLATKLGQAVKNAGKAAQRREPSPSLFGTLESLVSSLGEAAVLRREVDGINHVTIRDGSDNNRREPSPSFFGSLESLVSSLGEAAVLRRDNVSRDLIDALRLLSRQVDELD